MARKHFYIQENSFKFMLMDSIAEKVKETIKTEEIKNFQNTNLKDFQQLIDEMRRLGIEKKMGYNLPLADTIGKGYYSSLNRFETK